MSSRLLPHASEVTKRAMCELTAHGELKLARELAEVHEATCALVQAIQSEREAEPLSIQIAKRREQIEAIQRLRIGAAT